MRQPRDRDEVRCALAELQARGLTLEDASRLLGLNIRSARELLEEPVEIDAARSDAA